MNKYVKAVMPVLTITGSVLVALFVWEKYLRSMTIKNKAVIVPATPTATK